MGCKFYVEFEKNEFWEISRHRVFPYFTVPAQCAQWAETRGHVEIECLKGHGNRFKPQIGGFYD